MTAPFKAKIAGILDLTRAGKLEDAVFAIQAALTGKPPATPADVDGDLIDMQPPARAGDPWTSPLDGLPSEDDQAPATPANGKANGPSKAGAQAAKARSTGFTTHSFQNAFGARSYKLYVPATYCGQAMPLIVMLHGCTQSADDFAAGTRMNLLADEYGFLVAYPEQSKAANASKCWNWFNTADQKRDIGEPAIIADLTRQIMAEYAVDSARVFVAGLSAGGAAAAVLGEAYPDLYAAVGVHSGLACGAAADMMSAFGAMQNGGPKMPRPVRSALTRAIIFHGDRDQTVHTRNGDQVAAQFMDERLASSTVSGTVSGVRYTQTIYEDASGARRVEQWVIHGGAHAWSGGSSSGSYTAPKGPDASREMIRFFLTI